MKIALSKSVVEGILRDMARPYWYYHFAEIENISSHDQKVIAKAERRSDSVAHKLRSKSPRSSIGYIL